MKGHLPRHSPPDVFIVGKTATGSAVKTIPGQHSTGGQLISWPVSAKAHPGGSMEIPGSASLTSKPQNVSPWRQGNKEKADKDSISDGRKYAQALGSLIRTRFRSTSLHQRQVPLPAHSCHPTLAFPSYQRLTSSVPLLWLGRLKTLSDLSHTTAMGTSKQVFLRPL